MGASFCLVRLALDGSQGLVLEDNPGPELLVIFRQESIDKEGIMIEKAIMERSQPFEPEDEASLWEGSVGV